MKPLSAKARRITVVAVTILLVLPLLTPLWVTCLESPQYRGDERLKIDLYAGRVEGDLREIETLNQYVGVTLPLDAPELKIAPYGFGALLALALLGAALPLSERRRRFALGALVGLMVVGSLVGAGILEYRLYEMGHDRTHAPMARVKDFTPPILGSKKIANFTVTTWVGVGGWGFIVALLLAAWGAFAPEGQPLDKKTARADNSGATSEGLESSAPPGAPGDASENIEAHHVPA